MLQQGSVSGAESEVAREPASSANDIISRSGGAVPDPFEDDDEDLTGSLVPAELFPGLRLHISSIEWERVWVTLTLNFSSQPDGEVDFVIYDTLRAFPVDGEKIDACAYRIRINVTNFRDRHQLPNGTWRFLSVIGGQRGPIASYPLARANELAASGRSYLYNRNLSTYVITFGLSQDDRADVVMRSYQLNRPKPKPKPKPKQKPKGR